MIRGGSVKVIVAGKSSIFQGLAVSGGSERVDAAGAVDIDGEGRRESGWAFDMRLSVALWAVSGLWLYGIRAAIGGFGLPYAIEALF